MATRRIDLSLLDDDLKTLINSSAKIFPVPYSYIQSGFNSSNYAYVRVNDTAHKNEVYVWDDNKFSLIGADDYETLWSQIKEKPVTFPPDLHNHNDLYYTKLEVVGMNTLKVDYVEGKGLSSNDFDNDMKDKLLSTVDESVYLRDALITHQMTSSIHVSGFDRDEITKISSKADKVYVDTNLANKVAISTFNGHASNTSVHITQDEKDYFSTNLDKTLTHTQVIPSVEWVIPHNLNKYPDVLIIDNFNEIIIGKIMYDDTNTLHITFTNEINGIAILN